MLMEQFKSSQTWALPWLPASSRAVRYRERYSHNTQDHEVVSSPSQVPSKFCKTWTLNKWAKASLKYKHWVSFVKNKISRKSRAVIDKVEMTQEGVALEKGSRERIEAPGGAAPCSGRRTGHPSYNGLKQIQLRTRNLPEMAAGS